MVEWRLLVGSMVFVIAACCTSCDSSGDEPEGDADMSSNPSSHGCFHLHMPPMEPDGIHLMEMPDGSICQITVGPSEHPPVPDLHIIVEPEHGADCDYVGLYTFQDAESAYRTLTPPILALCFHRPQPGTDRTPVQDQNTSPPTVGVWHHQNIPE